MISIHQIDSLVGELKEKGEALIKQLVKEGVLVKDDHVYLGGESITTYSFNVYDGVGPDESKYWPSVTVIKQNRAVKEIQVDDTAKTHYITF